MLLFAGRRERHLSGRTNCLRDGPNLLGHDAPSHEEELVWRFICWSASLIPLMLSVSVFFFFFFFASTRSSPLENVLSGTISVQINVKYSICLRSIVLVVLPSVSRRQVNNTYSILSNPIRILICSADNHATRALHILTPPITI
ncbi:hypothetical protein B5807_05062 [Epicoccum nigrum]|uniref:Uncharacterized protein n=1 Tax=Epicoccum nigrum TaxID=105696 RepID=A0A1Y2M2J3_EPING|nr:hypothetical protein B5807_05062 [Epicoccum nigrum]